MTTDVRADAVVLGGGTAGANVAQQLASRGMSVVLLERRELASAGARWCNGVLDWQFRRAGLQPPSGAERVAESVVGHMAGPDGVPKLTINGSPVVRADMVALGDRLRCSAAESGVVAFEQVGPLEVALVGNRPASVEFEGVAVQQGPSAARSGVVDASDAAPRHRTVVSASLFVDASGRAGALRRRVPELAAWCTPLRGNELCTASDFELRVTDRPAALAFLESSGAQPGESVSALGTHGGFSTRGITVSEDIEHVSVLVGCLANGRYGTGPSMLEEVRRAHRWIGEPFSGGSGVIPLRRTWARITSPGVALVGDAACQVFPAHGSGIGLGLIAGHMLAETVAGADDPGDPEILWQYQAAWHREFSGTLAAFDGFRRMSTALGSAGVAEMFDAGLMSEQMVLAGLDQRWATPPSADLPATVLRLGAHRSLASALVPKLLRAQLAGRFAARCPPGGDLESLARWDRTVARLLGPLPT